MTRVDLAARLQNFFQNPNYYQSVDLNDSIQDGLDEVCALTGCVFASATLPFQGNKTYYDLLTLLPNYVGVFAIFNSVIKRWLYPTSLRKLQNVRYDWETAYGTPYWFVPVTHRYIAIFMKPNVSNYGNMQIFYRASAPSPLTDQITLPIPDDHIHSLESYCITDLLEQNQEFQKAMEYFESGYLPDADKLRIYMQNKRNIGRQQRLMD